MALDDFTLRVLDVADSHAGGGLTLRSASGVFTCAAFDADNSLVAAGSQSGSVYLWDAQDGSLLAQFSDLHSDIAAITFTFACAADEDENDLAEFPRLVAVAIDGPAMSWALSESDPYPAAPFSAAAGPLVQASFDAKGRWLACAAVNAVTIWKVCGKSPEELGPPLKSEDSIHAIAIDSAGAWCALGHITGEIRVMPVASPSAR